MSQVPTESPRLDTVAWTLDEIIGRRRSIRSYRPDAVPDALVGEIIDLARRAPSSMDGQPCHFIVVRDRAARESLAGIKTRHCPDEKKAFPSGFVADAPIVIAVCVDRDRAHERGLETAVLATAFLLLAAESRGLAGVYLSARRDGDPGLAAEIRAVLGLPTRVDPITLVPLGYPRTRPAPKSLRPLGEIVHHETFDRAARAVR